MKKQMGNESCLGVADDSDYSSPMPVIGIYIITSTLVCLLLLICDVLHAYRRKKPWLPCRFFSLNSLTLTLLGIATKLQVDLTTSMPSAQDQLSKLSGILLLTISMGFFMPSLADTEGFELFGNMASLTILVATVTVNICIQMYTGVIFSFFYAEHIVALVLMLLTLFAMWYIVFIKDWMMGSMDENWRFLKSQLNERNKASSKTQEFQQNYEADYMTNPQFAVCMFTNYVTYAGILCLFSLVVILQACFRTFFLKNLQKFCGGESDYRWSVWIVVVAQILTLVVGTSAATFRWLFFATRYNPSKSYNLVGYLNIQDFKVFARIISNWRIYHFPLKSTRLTKSVQLLEELVIYSLFITQIMMAWTNNVVMLSSYSVRNAFTRVERNANEVFDYLEQNATKDVESWIGKCRMDHPYHLIELLTRTQPSSEQRGGSKCCLLLVFLVKVATISIPSDLAESLAHALDEAFEILYFLDEHLASAGFSSSLNRKVAEDLWMRRESQDHWFQKIFMNPLREKYPTDKEPSLARAVHVIDDFTRLLERFPVLVTVDEIRLLKDVIYGREISTVGGLGDGLKQLFVDTLYQVLPRLPDVISEYVSQSPAAEREKRLRVGLKYICKFELLKLHVRWLSGAENDVGTVRVAQADEIVEDE